MQALETGFYQAVLPLDAICQLKTSGRAEQLLLFEFPSADNCNEVTRIMNDDFDTEAKKKAMEDVQKLITDQVRKNAKDAGTNAG